MGEILALTLIAASGDAYYLVDLHHGDAMDASNENIAWRRPLSASWWRSHQIPIENFDNK